MIDSTKFKKYVNIIYLRRLRELSIWYRSWAKTQKYKKGIYRKAQKTKQWKEARQIHLKMFREMNHFSNKEPLICWKCNELTPEWALVIHHTKYDWNFIFEVGIQLICRKCHNNNSDHQKLNNSKSKQ